MPEEALVRLGTLIPERTALEELSIGSRNAEHDGTQHTQLGMAGPPTMSLGCRVTSLGTTWKGAFVIPCSAMATFFTASRYRRW
mmetsp:Transcript_115532/g.359832  ORF Transcript_115532/g.359832 Transcript_115532/m.359832 type:complete len:84 (-) Transcript_115532:475-726(-)